MINNKNFKIIHDFAKTGHKSGLEKDKLIALHRLVQMKGELIESDDDRLDGERAYHYGEGNYIVIIHKPVNNESFFPCKLHTLLIVKN